MTRAPGPNKGGAAQNEGGRGSARASAVGDNADQLDPEDLFDENLDRFAAPLGDQNSTAKSKKKTIKAERNDSDDSGDSDAENMGGTRTDSVAASGTPAGGSSAAKPRKGKGSGNKEPKDINKHRRRIAKDLAKQIAKNTKLMLSKERIKESEKPQGPLVGNQPAFQVRNLQVYANEVRRVTKSDKAFTDMLSDFGQELQVKGKELPAPGDYIQYTKALVQYITEQGFSVPHILPFRHDDDNTPLVWKDYAVTKFVLQDVPNVVEALASVGQGPPVKVKQENKDEPKKPKVNRSKAPGGAVSGGEGDAQSQQAVPSRRPEMQQITREAAEVNRSIPLQSNPGTQQHAADGIGTLLRTAPAQSNAGTGGTVFRTAPAQHNPGTQQNAADVIGNLFRTAPAQSNAGTGGTQFRTAPVQNNPGTQQNAADGIRTMVFPASAQNNLSTQQHTINAMLDGTVAAFHHYMATMPRQFVASHNRLQLPVPKIANAQNNQSTATAQKRPALLQPESTPAPKRLRDSQQEPKQTENLPKEAETNVVAKTVATTKSQEGNGGAQAVDQNGGAQPIDPNKETQANDGSNQAQLKNNEGGGEEVEQHKEQDASKTEQEAVVTVEVPVKPKEAEKQTEEVVAKVEGAETKAEEVVFEDHEFA